MEDVAYPRIGCIVMIDFPINKRLGNPIEWVYCVVHFYYEKTREKEKVEFTSIHLKQEAL